MRNIMGDSPSPNIACREFRPEFNTSNVGLLGQPDSAATYFGYSCSFYLPRSDAWLSLLLPRLLYF